MDKFCSEYPTIIMSISEDNNNYSAYIAPNTYFVRSL